MRLIGGLVSLALLLAVCAGGGALWLVRNMERPGPLAEDALLEVSEGSGMGDIAALLERAGVVGDARLFEVGARLVLWRDGGTLKAGEYMVPAGMSARAVLDMLVAGRVHVRKLTVPEGLTARQVVALIQQSPALAGEVGPVPADGTLLPENYHYRRGDSRAEMLARMRRALDEALAELWPKRAEGLPFDSPERALVLASIVEKETANADERRHIAGVFVNRLRRGMRLQSDPTVIYGLTGGAGALGRPLTGADLDTDNAFNTYQIDGLPPRPIANPGRDSIAAVLNPAETEDLYFVADGSGGHAFARTLAEHNRNVAKWRRLAHDAHASE
jgi:UPF0755 protein